MPKLSSKTASARQDSPTLEQSAARSEALAHLFDDDNPTDQTGTSITTTASPPTLLIANPSTSLPVENQHNRQAVVDRTAPSKQADCLQPKALPVVDTRLQISTPSSHDTLSHPPPEPISSQREDSNEMASANNFIPTGQFRNMRACMVCSIVKTQQQFLSQGCPNCSFLELRGNQDMIAECTSQVFEGLITISDTSRSWVARWQRLEGYVPGCYAVQVEGVLPDEVITTAEESGVHYIPRDGSVNEALPTDA